MMRTMIKTYSELMTFSTFEERLKYLMTKSVVGTETFGYERYLNQVFYKSKEWKRIRDEVIIRDGGCDLGCPDRSIGTKIYIHHMNPITPEDVQNHTSILISPEYLICVSHETHQAIHYGNADNIIKDIIERKPFDTCPWKGV